MIAPRKPHSMRWPEPLVPLWVAESVCAEVSRFLGVDVPERYPAWLAARAERCFRRNPSFRASIRQPGHRGRDALRVYLRHWLASLLQLERPDLHRVLPPDFDLGHPLPAGTSPRINRRSSLPLPKPMAWNPDRVVQHRHWRFLVEASASRPSPSATKPPRRTTRAPALREHDLRMLWPSGSDL